MSFFRGEASQRLRLLHLEFYDCNNYVDLFCEAGATPHANVECLSLKFERSGWIPHAAWFPNVTHICLGYGRGVDLESVLNFQQLTKLEIIYAECSWESVDKFLSGVSKLKLEYVKIEDEYQLSINKLALGIVESVDTLVWCDFDLAKGSKKPIIEACKKSKSVQAWRVDSKISTPRVGSLAWRMRTWAGVETKHITGFIWGISSISTTNENHLLSQSISSKTTGDPLVRGCAWTLWVRKVLTSIFARLLRHGFETFYIVNSDMCLWILGFWISSSFERLVNKIRFFLHILSFD